jgi:cytochrome P450 PksS
VLKDNETFTQRRHLARKPNRHITFGTGIHVAFGHQLARIEGICALKALFRRRPKLSLAIDASQVTWRKNPGLRARQRLKAI